MFGFKKKKEESKAEFNPYIIKYEDKDGVMHEIDTEAEDGFEKFDAMMSDPTNCLVFE